MCICRADMPRGTSRSPTSGMISSTTWRTTLSMYFASSSLDWYFCLMSISVSLNIVLIKLSIRRRNDHFVDQQSFLNDRGGTDLHGGIDCGNLAGHGDKRLAAQSHSQANFD